MVARESAFLRIGIGEGLEVRKETGEVEEQFSDNPDFSFLGQKGYVRWIDGHALRI